MTVILPLLSEPHSVITIGKFRPIVSESIRVHWRTYWTSVVVLTGERRRHYLERHAEITKYESHIGQLIRWPDELYRNKSDSDMLIVYKMVDDETWLRAAIWISGVESKLNSIFSLRLAKPEEVMGNRRMRQCVWRNE